MGKLGAAIFTVCLSALYAVIIRTAVVCLKKTDERAIGDTLGSKIAIVLSNLVMAGIEAILVFIFLFIAEGSNGDLFNTATEMYVSGFFGRMLLLAVIYCMPMINLLLYRLCYIKTGISSWWVIVPFTLIFGGVSFLMLLVLYDPIISFFPIALILMIFIIYFFRKTGRWYITIPFILVYFIAWANVLQLTLIGFLIIPLAVIFAVWRLSRIHYFKNDLSRLIMVIPLSVLIAGLIFIFNYGEYDWSIIINWIKIEWFLM